MLGPDHEDTLCNLSGLSTALAELQRTDEAIQIATIAHASLAKVRIHVSMLLQAFVSCCCLLAPRGNPCCLMMKSYTPGRVEEIGTLAVGTLTEKQIAIANKQPGVT